MRSDSETNDDMLSDPMDGGPPSEDISYLAFITRCLGEHKAALKLQEDGAVAAVVNSNDSKFDPAAVPLRPAKAHILDSLAYLAASSEKNSDAVAIGAVLSSHDASLHLVLAGLPHNQASGRLCDILARLVSIRQLVPQLFASEAESRRYVKSLMDNAMPDATERDIQAKSRLLDLENTAIGYSAAKIKRCFFDDDFDKTFLNFADSVRREQHADLKDTNTNVEGEDIKACLLRRIRASTEISTLDTIAEYVRRLSATLSGSLDPTDLDYNILRPLLQGLHILISGKNIGDLLALCSRYLRRMCIFAQIHCQTFDMICA